jgi:hypothetical protein
LTGVLARFSGDGARLLVISDEGGVWLWDLTRIESDTLPVPPLHQGQLFASKSRESITAEIEGQAVILKSPTDQYSLPHAVPLRRVAFTPDEHYLITESQDGRAWIWDIHSRTLAGPPMPVRYDAALTTFSCPVRMLDEWDRRTLPDLAALLGTKRPDGMGGMTPLAEAELGRLLAELKQTQPADFAENEARRSHWHHEQAAAAELAMDWDAAVFHWECALDANSKIRNPKSEIPVESHLAYARQTADLLRQAILGGCSRWSVIPPRQPWATPDLIDLGRFNMKPLAGPFTMKNDAPFRELPAGVQTFGGIRFDVRGFLRINHTNPVVIRLGRSCKRIHFLHAASQPPSWNRESVGAYQVTYASGSKVAVSLRNPEDVGPHSTHDFYAVSSSVRTNATGELRSAIFWSSLAPSPGGRKKPVYLTGTSWELPAEHRGEVVKTLELRAGTADSVPLVFAVTVEVAE